MTGAPEPEDERIRAERAIAERFRRGDETVLREAYDRYGGLVHRVGMACLPSHHDAEDATQATFVAAWRGRETYDPGRGTLAAWLLGIARRQAVDRLRVLHRQRDLTLMLRRMRADPAAEFFSEVPTGTARVRARVSAALVRVAEVEQAALRRDGELQPRQRRRMTPEGLDPHYSDSYVPTEVDLLAYGTGDHPQWTTLGRLG